MTPPHIPHPPMRRIGWQTEESLLWCSEHSRCPSFLEVNAQGADIFIGGGPWAINARPCLTILSSIFCRISSWHFSSPFFCAVERDCVIPRFTRFTQTPSARLSPGYLSAPNRRDCGHSGCLWLRLPLTTRQVEISSSVQKYFQRLAKNRKTYDLPIIRALPQVPRRDASPRRCCPAIHGSGRAIFQPGDAGGHVRTSLGSYN